MADSPTTRNRLRKQEVGAKTNAWGTDWNEDGGSDRLDEAMDGYVAFSLSGSKTLTSTNYESDEARMRVINVTGGTGGTVTIPAVEKWYLVINGASGDVTISNGSNSVVVKSGNVMPVTTNGTAVYLGQASDFGSTIPKSSGTPTAGSHLVNKDYADGLAFSSSLPNQSGNSGKFLTTNGTAASWALVPLASGVSGTLPVANGGTGATSFTQNRVLKGDGTSAVTLSLLYDNGTNVGIGTTSPAELFEVRRDQSASATKIKATNSTVNAGTQAGFEAVTGTANSAVRLLLTDNAGAPYSQIARGSAVVEDFNDCNTHQLRTNAGVVKVHSDATIFRSGSDNAMNLGGASNRWATVFAGTSTINTSDGREKTECRALTSAEVAAARTIANLVGIYQWLAMIAEKGEDGARLHCGVIAQDVVAALTAEGLDPFRYGFVCYDEWEDGDRYGVRPAELAFFLLAAQEQRITALEAA